MRAARSLLAMCVLAAPASAFAQVASGASAAEALYQDGQRLVGAGDIHAACLKFGESQKIDPRLNTLIALAACHEKEGKIASAWGEFLDAAEQAAARHDGTRERFSRGHAATLAARLHRVAVIVRYPPVGVEVALGGKTYGPGALGSAIPLDPGAYEVVVTAPGKKRWARSLVVDASPGEERIAVVLEDASLAPTTSTMSTVASTPAAPTARPLAEPVSSRSGRHTAAVLVASGGGAALVVGVVAGLVALGKKGDANSACGPGGLSACSTTNMDLVTTDRSGAVTAGTVADVGLLTGAALIGLGALLWFTTPSSSGPRVAARGFETTW